MNCPEFRESLDNYELLDDRELADFECHAQLCDACRRELEFYKSIIQTTASLPIPDPPVDLVDRVNARIDNESKLNRMISGIAWSVRNNAYRYAAVAACLVVGLAVGLNSGMIKDGLSGGGDDGVIRERTVSETQHPVSAQPDTADEETAEADNETEPEPEQEKDFNPPNRVKDDVSVSAEKTLAAQVKPTAAPESAAEKKPLNSLPVKTGSPTEKTDVPSLKETAQTTTDAPAAVQSIATEAPVINTPAATATVEAAPAATEESIGKYTIARANYYIPKDETAAAEEVTEEPSAEEYEIKKAGYQIAQGDYTGNVKEAGGVSSVSISDKIVVNASDADAVAGEISNFGIPSTNGFYTTVTSTFYELLSKLDAEGIEYSYSLQYSSGDKVVFKLVMR